MPFYHLANGVLYLVSLSQQEPVFPVFDLFMDYLVIPSKQQLM